MQKTTIRLLAEDVDGNRVWTVPQDVWFYTTDSPSSFSSMYKDWTVDASASSTGLSFYAFGRIVCDSTYQIDTYADGSKYTINYDSPFASYILIDNKPIVCKTIYNGDNTNIQIAGLSLKSIVVGLCRATTIPEAEENGFDAFIKLPRIDMDDGVKRKLVYSDIEVNWGTSGIIPDPPAPPIETAPEIIGLSPANNETVSIGSNIKITYDKNIARAGLLNIFGIDINGIISPKNVVTYSLPDTLPTNENLSWHILSAIGTNDKVSNKSEMRQLIIKSESVVPSVSNFKYSQNTTLPPVSIVATWDCNTSLDMDNFIVTMDGIVGTSTQDGETNVITSIWNNITSSGDYNVVISNMVSTSGGEGVTPITQSVNVTIENNLPKRIPILLPPATTKSSVEKSVLGFNTYGIISGTEVTKINLAVAPFYSLVRPRALIPSKYDSIDGKYFLNTNLPHNSTTTQLTNSWLLEDILSKKRVGAFGNLYAEDIDSSELFSMSYGNYQSIITESDGFLHYGSTNGYRWHISNTASDVVVRVRPRGSELNNWIYGAGQWTFVITASDTDTKQIKLYPIYMLLSSMPAVDYPEYISSMPNPWVEQKSKTIKGIDRVPYKYLGITSYNGGGRGGTPSEENYEIQVQIKGYPDLIDADKWTPMDNATKYQATGRDFALSVDNYVTENGISASPSQMQSISLIYGTGAMLCVKHDYNSVNWNLTEDYFKGDW